MKVTQKDKRKVTKKDNKRKTATKIRHKYRQEQEERKTGGR